MATLLITGSRDATPAMLDYAVRCVAAAKRRGHDIIVGDADGIDAAVMDACHAMGVAHHIVGGYGRMRRRTPSGTVYAHPGNYISRDWHMASKCQICVGIWNERSNGTRKTVLAAVKLGVPEVHMMVQRDGKWVEYPISELKWEG